jgi:hypothetical protein
MYVSSGLEAGGGVFRVLPVFATGVIFIGALRNKWQATFKRDYGLMTFASFGMIGLLPLVMISSVMGDRFGYYLMPLAYAIQARAYKLFRPGLSLIVFLVPLLAAVVLFIGWTSLSWIFLSCYTPYKTWWSPY